MIKTIRFNVDPIGKPRMTQRDRWKKRPCVNKYYGFKDVIKLQANVAGLTDLPGRIHELVFVIPMPKSWSKTKMLKMNDTPHEQKPDMDNMLKALQDCLCKEDKSIWRIDSMYKVWGINGQIILTIDV